MRKDNTIARIRTELVVGINLGDKRSPTCVLNAVENCPETGTVTTSPVISRNALGTSVRAGLQLRLLDEKLANDAG